MKSGTWRRYFLPPAPVPGDEEETRRAALLHWTLLCNLGLMVVAVLAAFVGHRVPRETGWLALGFAGLSLFLLREVGKGRGRRAAVVLLSSAFFVITADIALLGTIRAPVTGFYLALVVGAGFLFDLRAVIVTVGLCSLAVGGLIIAENAGVLPRPDYGVSLTQWITTTTLMAVVGGWTFAALRSIRLALDRADHEIRERRQAEEAMRSSEAKFRMIFEASPLAMALVDEAGNVISLNRRFVTDYGYTPADVPTVSAWHALAFPDPDDRQARLAEWREQLAQQASAGAQIVSREVRVICKDGSARSVSFILTPVGSFRLFMLHDATERNRLMAELELREARFRAVFDHAPVGISFTADGAVMMVNAEHARITGVSIEDSKIPGIFGRVSHPEDYARQLEASKPFHEGKVGHYTVEKRYLHPDGRVQWAELSSRFLPGPVAGLNWIVTTVTDIGQRKDAEAALRQSERQLAHAMDQAHLAYWEFDGATGLFTFNDRFYTLYGTTAEREGGYHMSFEVYAREFLPPEERELVPATVAHMLAGNSGEFDVQHRILRRDGELRDIVARMTLLRDAEGRVVGTRGANQDVTELKRREALLREALARLQKIASRVPGVVYQFRMFPDGRSCFPFASEAIRDIYRVTPEEVATDASKVFRVLHPEDYDGIVASIQQSARDLTPWNHTYRVQFDDGTVRWLAGNAVPERADDGGVLWHGFITDITDRKTMESQLLQAQRMEAIGALAGGVAHDLNNILSPIVMMTGLLKDRLADESDRKLLEISHGSALRGAAIIKQLLAYSRGQPLERCLVQPQHLINEMAKMMRETFPREIALQTRLAADLWPLQADPTQLHQVIINLCVNARDAMPGGGRLVVQGTNRTLSRGDPQLPPHAQPGPYVVIAVVDTGHGIPPEVRQKIFDPFFTTKPFGKGTGLGLSTVLGIVRNHGGFVDVDSAPEQGTTFRIYLPALPGAAAVPEGPVRAPATVTGKGRTILVVDDERNLREGVRLTLERAEFRVLLAVHGKDALNQYLGNRESIGLVLTDLMMPVMNGVALVRALRETNPGLRILAMSGLAEMEGARELGALGVPDVLIKPFDAPALLEAVERALADATNA